MCTWPHLGCERVSQWRNAFKRNSSNQSGSPFSAEIWRTTSSLSPLGITVVAISVTNPYLYSSPVARVMIFLSSSFLLSIIISQYGQGTKPMPAYQPTKLQKITIPHTINTPKSRPKSHGAFILWMSGVGWLGGMKMNKKSGGEM